MVIDDLLSALMGIEGRYISIKRVRGKEGHVIFQIDQSMDFALQVRSKGCVIYCMSWMSQSIKGFFGMLIVFLVFVLVLAIFG